MKKFNDELLDFMNIGTSTYTCIKNIKDILLNEDYIELDELKSINTIPSSFLTTGGLKIYTNLDLNLQKEMEQNMKENITNEKLEIASIAMEPQTGKVLALIGGVVAYILFVSNKDT